MSWLKAFFAGVIGAALMAAILAASIAMGFKVLDFSMMWGTLVGLPIGTAAWITGFCIHLVVGGIFGLFYAVIFNAFSGAGVIRGGGIGIIHALITGLAIALLPLVNPLMDSGRLPSPGPYFSRHGVLGILFFFGIHIVYGATVGLIYARQVMMPAARKRETRNEDVRLAA